MVRIATTVSCTSRRRRFHERTLQKQCHPERGEGSAFLLSRAKSQPQIHQPQIQKPCPALPPADSGESGYLLLALVVVMFLLALLLTIAAPTMARSLQRDKEVESEHRAQEYVRAIHNYYMKFNTYPASLEVLLNQNNQHFLRQQYKDPLTGGDYKLIHFGEAKTEVKGFFGEPLEGVAQGSLGANAGSASGIGNGSGSTASGTGASAAGGSGFGSGFSMGSGGFSSGSSGTQSGTAGTGASSGSAFGSGTGSGTIGSSSPSSGSGGAFGGTSATQFQGSKGMIVGVGSNGSGPAEVEWNGSANIQDWEFLYDHRTWLIRQKVSIFGGSMATTGSTGAFGSSAGSAFGSSTSGASGSSSSGAFGSSGATFGTPSGTGSTGTSTSGTGTGTTPAQQQ